MDTLFTAIAGTGTSVTLHRDDVINGGENAENHLQVTMQGNFQTGFDGVKDANGVVTPSLVNIDQVDLINNTNSALQFNALNAGDIPVWNLINTNTSSQTSITNLSNPGLTVNIQDQHRGAAAIGFVASTVTGSNDSITIGLDRVGTIKTSTQAEQAVSLQTDDVENIILSSTGPIQNIVNLANLADSENLTVTGTQALKITDMSASIDTVDGSDASGNLTIAGASAANITSLTLGAGNDTYTTENDGGTFIATPGLKYIDMGDGNDAVAVKAINPLATVHGGGGSDTITFNSAAAAKYSLTMDGVETLVVDNNGGILEFDGTNMKDVTTLTVQNTSYGVVLDNYSAPELTVNAKSDVAITTNGVTDIDLNIQVTTYKSTFTANEATSLTVNLGTNTLGDPDTGTPQIDAGLVQNLTINSANSTDGLFNLGLNTDLKSVNNLVINGGADVNMYAGAGTTVISMGQEAPNLFVDATNSSGDIKIAFDGSAASQNLLVHGTMTGENSYMVNSNYDNVTINTGIGTDIVDLTKYDASALLSLAQSNNLYVDLGGQATDMIYLANISSLGQAQQDLILACFHGVDADNIIQDGTSLGYIVTSA